MGLGEEMTGETVGDAAGEAAGDTEESTEDDKKRVGVVGAVEGEGVGEVPALERL